MTQTSSQIYLIPGMAAGEEIFQNLKLPDQYEITILNWLIPESSETLLSYSRRMAEKISGPNPILIGVSFGGVVAQEMQEFVNPEKTIIISSVKSRQELPLTMRFADWFKLYKLIPTGRVLSSPDLTKFSLGPKSKKRLQLYQKYLHVRDKQYLDWAIEQMVGWERKHPAENVFHIQGDSDTVFPIKYISDCIVVKGGTHIMILNRAREISEKLTAIIEDAPGADIEKKGSIYLKNSI